MKVLVTILATLLLAASTARGDSVHITGSGPSGGSFDGSLMFFGNDSLLRISLTNTSALDNGGYITGFVFNSNSSEPLTFSLQPSATPFVQLAGPSASPYGIYQHGAAIGGDFLGGGGPAGGIAAGQTRIFDFMLDGPGAAGYTAAQVMSGSSASNPGFVVRFRGFENGDSDKIVAGASVPLPAAAWGGLGLMLGLTGLRFYRRWTRPEAISF